MSSIPPGIPERPTPPPKSNAPRGRDRALSSSPGPAKKPPAPPPPTPPPAQPPTPPTPPRAIAYEYGAGEPAPLAAAPVFTHPSVLAAPPRKRNPLILWFVTLAILAIALAVTLPFTLGVYFGNQDRARFVERQAQEHFQRALTYESETYTQLAIAELELALEYKPDYEPARAKLEQLKNLHTEIVEQEPQDVVIAKQLYASAEEALAAQDWNNAIDLFEELRRVKSDYRTVEVDALLVTSYLAAGRQALDAEDVDLARRRFEAAIALDPDNAEARTQRERAVMYFNGVAMMGSDWSNAVLTLEELYGRDPKFGDVSDKLQDAHIGYGDFASDQGAYCIAAREYDAAISLGAGIETQTKMLAANDACKNAILNPTPLPTATPEGGIPTPDPFATPNPFGTPIPVTSAGGILYAPGMRVRSAPCNGTGDIRGSVQDAAGNPIPFVGVKIYNDYGYRPPFARTDTAGEYEIALGSDNGIFHLVIVDDFGSNVSGVLDVEYPGGNAAGCHIVVNWTRIR